MIDLASDLAAIYAGPEFAKRFDRVRTAVPNLEVRLIMGSGDDDALEGRAVALVRKASFALGTDVRVDDMLVALEAVDPLTPAGTVLRVIDHPRRINDGLEVEALLGSATS